MTVHEPLILTLGPLEVSGFALGVLAAFAIAHLVAASEMKRLGQDPSPIGDLVFVAIITGLLGAKLYYVALTGDRSSLFSRGGFVFWGGLIGGIIGVVGAIRYMKLSVMRIADPAAIALAAAYGVGRTGCWAIGDDYGRPWSGPLAVSFPEGAPPSTAENLREMFGVQIPLDVPADTVIAVHPTQIYETVLGFGMFLILWRMRAHAHAAGWLFGVYMVLAGVERFVVEFVRAKDDLIFGVLSIAQVISVMFVLTGVVWMRLRSNRADERKTYATT